ncbi:hydroxymethylglutaryl-CoA lyase [Congregibacter litoralis]|uniref:Isopropylmalate/homocitrate/citramalate synthase n=1 Tax=Congregibacter litoralis KT71 TaxID=314285 RepID=A4ACY2_9GAMM|nr:hydroxymethylglutaryl-CoA lyase [Congregibacter litoralis]EAQ96173.1 Isopropylmalate/homocitrate/citramalate synthase [Congregibacter litoralis KT71]
MKDRIIINEVGPRDGLQSQDGALTLDQRFAFVEAVLDAGIRHCEMGSFVSPKAVPQMAGTGDLARRLGHREGVELSALVPNMKGYELARDAGVNTMAVVVSATETMNQKNINLSMEQTLEVARAVIERGHGDGNRVQAYLAVAFECPFEGSVDPGYVRSLAAQLLEAGASELVIADTIGAANPAQVKSLMSALGDEHDSAQLACHFHDTRALGLANIFAAMESGIRRFDASVGGLGGCPFAPGAKGNVATEDVVMMAEQMGFTTGVDMPALLGVVNLMSEMLGRPQGGRAHYWLTRNAA